ncbi:MAG: hypothetical protein ACJ8DV_02100 [Microvirga sp.]|jgi:hypothetical protein
MGNRPEPGRENAALDAVKTRQEAEADAARKSADQSAASTRKNETAPPDSPKRQGDKMADAVDVAAGKSKDQV